MSRLTNHLRSNAVAYLALFIALGGTSYAAINLPAGSVGTKQLRNGSVTAGKLDPKTIGGSVRHWAFVSEDAHVIGGSRGVVFLSSRGAPPYLVSWGSTFSHSCAVLASSPGTEGSAPIADTIGIHVNEPAHRGDATVVWVSPSNGGTLLNARFYIAVIC